jgi:hypothetical protein
LNFTKREKMNEIANRQNIEISEWRETGPEQGILWRLQTLVQAVAWTIFTGFLGPIFSQSIYNLWREAWAGRVVELYEGPSLPTPLANPPSIEPVSQPPAPLPVPPLVVSQEPFSTKEEAQNALKALFVQPSLDLNAKDIRRCALAAQLDLSEAPFISGSRLEQIIKTLSLSEIQLPFPPTWNEWQKPAGLFLNLFEVLHYILNAEKLPANLKITFIFDPSIASDMAKKSIPFSDLFASLNRQESLKLFRGLSDEQARHFFELLLMSAHRNAQCLPQLQSVLAEKPGPYLSLFVNRPQYNPILDVYLNDLSR